MAYNMDTKATFTVLEEEGLEPRVAPQYCGKRVDKHDMYTLGKRQELRRLFGFSSMTAFAATLQNAWEFLLLSALFSLLNGGLAGSIWGFVVAAAGYLLIYASLGEIASIAPTAGGQYHWVSEFAPAPYQKYMSYITGWLCLTSWQVGMASGAFGMGTVIQGLLVLNYPDYVFHNWHGTLLTIAIITFALFVNLFLAKKLPFVESVMVTIHIFGFFAIVIPLWMFAPRQDASVVFTQFNNGGGWSSQGTSFMVGMLTSTVSLCFGDSIVHMAEETVDASRVLPRALMTGISFSILQGFVLIVTLCFTLGDLNYILFTPTGYPFIQVFFDATNSLTATNLMTTLIIINITSATCSFVATASRQTWSFARDGGLPASGFFAHVLYGWNLPVNSVLLSWLIVVLLSLINIGSTTAFNSLTSAAVAAILVSYLMSIGCVLRRRLRGELPEAPWSLGVWGTPINIGALCFCAVLLVFNFFPLSPMLTAQSMNYNIVIVPGVIIFATLYYLLFAHRTYVAPVTKVNRNL